MPRREFTKADVVEMIDEISPPTPTDGEHDAVWWNTNFGKLVRQEFENHKERLIKEIQQMADY